MAKKKTTTATQLDTNGQPVAVARKTRAPAVMAPEVQVLIDEQKKLADEAKARVKETTKEAKKLSKVVTLIAELGAWSLDQLGSAIERRRAALDEVKPGE